ncbi:ABC transporter substrate-binding protein [Micromonospora endolithica]|uniref:Amino acid ABC transporter substrate-binding protein n=1 Tax=Micromonospora endolithica TaxID=230091 RepID=A0A3A9ZQK1_9ACTN|nr:ABC transporter substrate-binding protein [Micromonospora endolithica]RKN50453.1 amino acid ABC transporter substrate-binding protein [Micromonospora endolithica]TWJ20862.1 amino acid/amide ABC transporter substrate-binding protein (HAAT family) [Micromonospora endolithica]
MAHPIPRVRRGLAATAAAGLLLAGAACSSGAADTTTVRVGLLVSLSGTYATVGEDMQRGFKLYLDTHGGKLGGRKVDLIVGDEGDGPATAVPAAQKLLERDRVVALTGLVGGATVDKVQTLTTEKKIPLVGANARPAFTPVGGKPRDLAYTWHTSYNSDEPGIAIAEYVKAQVGDGEVYAIGPDYQGGYDELRGFTDTFTRLGGKLANPDGKTTFTPFPSTENFLPYLNKAAETKPKAVYTFYAGAAAVAFVKQYAQSDLRDVPLYAAGFLTEGSVLTAQGPAATGIRNVLNYSPTLPNPTNQEFVAAWSAAGHTGQPTTFAMASYDAAAVLDRALAAVDGEVTGEKLNTAIGQVGRIVSPRGDWQFHPIERRPVQRWYLREVKADGPVLSNVLVQDLTTLPTT